MDFLQNQYIKIVHRLRIHVQKKGQPQINRSTLRFSNLFHRTGDTFCKLLLQNEEYNHGRNGTE